jgi:V8-like Glu-specific endopeptidase
MSLRILAGLLALAPVLALAQTGVTEMVEENPVEQALDEARRAEAAALEALYAAHQRVLELGNPGQPGLARAASDGKIVNGVLTSLFPTVGAFLKGEGGEGMGAWCTGTLIGCRTFLTARHCVDSERDPTRPAAADEVRNYRVFLQHGGLFGVDAIKTHPDYDFPFADLAVVSLGEAVDGIEPTRLNTGVVEADTAATIVGYGRSGGSRTDYGLKRMGAVRTSACADDERDLVCWDYDSADAPPGTDSNTCNADSGGPVLVDDADAAAGTRVLAGVVSGGTRADCLRRDHSYNVDVRAFARWVEQQTDDPLGPERCGTLPAVGGGGVSVLSASGKLDASRTGAHLFFPVPPGTARVRLAMNAQDDDGRIDFDLFARHGDRPSTTVADCRGTGSSQFAFCEFADPAPGNWFVWVKRNRGSGLYQLTATLFEAQAP